MPLVNTRADALRLEISDVEITGLHAVGAIPGVVVLAAAGLNGPGAGLLRSHGDGASISWRAPGSETSGTEVSVGTDGSYLLEDGEDTDKWLRVQVYADYLLSLPTEATVYLTDVFNNGVGHDNVTAGESTSGNVETYQITLVNDTATDLMNLKCWIGDGAENIEISMDGTNWYRPVTEE